MNIGGLEPLSVNMIGVVHIKQLLILEMYSVSHQYVCYFYRDRCSMFCQLY